MTRAAVACAGVLAVVALAGCGGSNRALSLPCSPQPQGALCIKVYNDHLSVKDVIVYLSASESPLGGKTWRLVLTAGGRTYPGASQRGTPPIQIFCKVNGQTTTTGDGCRDTLGEARASGGDFPGFNPPVSLRSDGDICVFSRSRRAERGAPRRRRRAPARPSPSASRSARSRARRTRCRSAAAARSSAPSR